MKIIFLFFLSLEFFFNTKNLEFGLILRIKEICFCAMFPKPITKNLFITFLFYINKFFPKIFNYFFINLSKSNASAALVLISDPLNLANASTALILLGNGNFLISDL